MNEPIEIKNSPLHGKGVFAKRNIAAGEVIVSSHVVLIDHEFDLPEELATLEFPWNDTHYALCLGSGSFFNHSIDYSAKILKQDQDALVQSFVASRAIEAGEEIFIYYNDDFEKYVG